MMTPAEKSVCAIIRGDIDLWSDSDAGGLQRVAEAAFHHNLHLVLFDTLKMSPTWNGWPTHFRELLGKAAVVASAVDLLRERELRGVLRRLDDCGVRAILLKGVPLAYTLYRSPVLRPRSDTDLLVRQADLKMVSRVLAEIGYVGPDFPVDKLTSYETAYTKRATFDVNHTLDVHWKINNAQLFANLLSFDEILAEAMKVPSLGPFALGLCYKHALLLACMHRFGHAHAPFYADGRQIYAGDHLRWVYDIHLLCLASNPLQWFEFATLAEAKGVAAFCVEGLNAAKEAFHTEIPARVMDMLSGAARSEAVNADRLRASGAAWFWANLLALPNLWQRLVLIKQVALPPPSYIMAKYKTDSWLTLPFFYGYRSVDGVFKTMKQYNSRRNTKGPSVTR